jgi:hypothetical protein
MLSYQITFPLFLFHSLSQSSFLLFLSTQAEKDLNCLSESISMGLLCTKDSPEGRPTMMDIVGRLQSIRDTFLGVVGIPKSQSNLTCLLGDASIAHNNTSEGQSSSTF